MEYNLRTAIVEMKKQEEPGINYIYAKTYNYVYLRAKSILRREADVQQLMQDVYVKMIESASEVEVENLYEWLGECTYRLGCGYYRKKKVREVDMLEMENSEFAARQIEYPEATSDVIAKSLEELPDLYQATFYAFYYDYLSVEKIADLMGCTEGIIINRLNYTRKYMIKALENCYEEKKIRVFYSVEAVCVALRKWSVDHCLGITVAQTVYAEICKASHVAPAPIYLEGKEFAGVNNTVVYHKPDDYTFLQDQADKYGKKLVGDKKIFGIFAAILVLGVVVVLAVVLMSGMDKEKNEETQTPSKIEEQQALEEETDAENPETAPKEEETIKVDDSEYIFPDSNTRELTRQEVEAFSKEELRLARNEIYARHGMIFGVDDLASYFSEKSWYKGTVSAEQFNDTVEMSLVEEANVELILEVEQSK